jgi:hypothetical protein
MVTLGTNSRCNANSILTWSTGLPRSGRPFNCPSLPCSNPVQTGGWVGWRSIVFITAYHQNISQPDQAAEQIPTLILLNFTIPNIDNENIFASVCCSTNPKIPTNGSLTTCRMETNDCCRMLTTTGFIDFGSRRESPAMLGIFNR